MLNRDYLFRQNEKVLEMRERLNEEDYRLISDYSNEFRMIIFENDILQRKLNNERSRYSVLKKKYEYLRNELD